MTLLTKYLFVYLYLLLVMGGAFVVSKRFRNNEISRNIIHICAGWSWVLYKLFFPATIHPVLISCSFVLLTVATTKMKVRFVERENGSLGTVYYNLSMLVMAVLGYHDPLRFDVFGVAMVCLCCGDAAANIIGSRYGTRRIYKKKSMQGTLACFVACVLGMLILKGFFGVGLHVWEICSLAVLCAATELFAGDYDNIAIPAVVYAAAYILLTGESLPHLLLSAAVGGFMFGISVKFRVLNLPASYLLFVLIFVLYYFGGLKSYLSLMLLFCVIIGAEKCLRGKTEKIFSSMNKEYGARNERQLIANCLTAVVAVAAYGITKSEMFLVAYFATIAETFGDSAASDVGVLSKAEPLDICTFKPVPRGVSGGVSALGTGAALVICLYSGAIYLCVYGADLHGLLIILVSSFAGIMLDSVLGSKFQAQYQCGVCAKRTEQERHCQMPTKLVKGSRSLDNTRVNLICNVFSCVLACLLMGIS